jgi:hypothetical protein
MMDLRENIQCDTRWSSSYNDIWFSEQWILLDGIDFGYLQSKVASAPGRPKLFEKSGPICHAAAKGMLSTKAKESSAIFASSLEFCL